MDELTTQITDELAAITGFLEQRLSRRSRWNGEANLTSASDNYGQARWDGSIRLNRNLAQTELRWRTMIHEALHHLSVGLTPTSYSDLRGWEEGTVEQLQRLIRNEVLDALAVSVPPNIFYDAERQHRLNGFVTALEELRQLLKADADSFYLNLLAIPVNERPAEVIAASAALPLDERIAFRRSFAIAFSVLRRTI